jgi:hypothetical protein
MCRRVAEVISDFVKKKLALFDLDFEKLLKIRIYGFLSRNCKKLIWGF